MKRRFFSLILVLSLLCSLAPSAGAEGTVFSDVPAGDWAEASIAKAAEYGLIKGVGGDRFGYGAYMTRASFVTILSRMFGWDGDAPASPSFSDVKPGLWYYEAVENARARGVVEEGVYFHPGDDITREDLAVMLIRALGYEALAKSWNGAPPFSDVTAHSGHIALANQFGIVNGVPQPDGSLLFLPTHSSTRQECAAMLVRAYERYHAPLAWLHGFYAIRSYAQIDSADNMDALSLGWSRVGLDSAGTPCLNLSPNGGNEWSVPKQSTLAIDHFQGNGTPYNLCVHATLSDRVSVGDSSASPLSVLLSGQAPMDALISAILRESGSYAGVTIDFEGLHSAEKDSFTAFMTALRAALPKDKTLFVCVQPPDWYAGYDYRALGEICDKVILMAHDYQDANLPQSWVGTAQTVNPSAPLNKVCAALATLTHPQTGVKDRSKLALAVSFTGVALRVDDQGNLAETTLYSPSPETLYQRLTQSDTVLGYDEDLAVPFAYYTTDQGRYRLWYEDARSVAAKLRLAHMFGVDGLSLWRLGLLPQASDSGLNYDIWTVLSR